jgi:protein-S-isoprenylcysteine O-methyltransferase Ste14
MSRRLVFGYTIVAYVLFLGVFLYAIGFLGNIGVPRSLDVGPASPLPVALAIDIALLAVFAFQHSVMARPGFKRWLTQYVPRPAERATYVLLSSLALALLFWQWRPLGGMVWHVTNTAGATALWALFAIGWVTVLMATFLINHFDLFGLRQAWLYFRGQEYTPLRFATPGPYRLVRHPLYVGWLLTFWATPAMSVSHVVFAIGTTAYILAAIRLEERDLVAVHGEAYARYRQAVPMLIPSLGRPFGRSHRAPARSSKM